MKLKLITVMLLLFAFKAVPAIAGGETRNGGNAVVCYQDESKKTIVSIELFDYWEGNRFYPNGTPVDLGDANLSIKEKISIFLNRVKLFDPTRADRYQQYADLLVNNLNDFMVNEIPGPAIDDDAPLGLPSAPCYKEQFAVQIKDPLPTERRFEISAPLFNDPLTSNDTKAGILLHEIVYRDAIDQDKQTTSVGARRLNYFYSTRFSATADSVDAKAVYDLANLPFISDGDDQGPSYPLALTQYGTRALVDLNPANQASGTKNEYNLKGPLHIKATGFELTADEGATLTIFRDQDSYRLLKIDNAASKVMVEGHELSSDGGIVFSETGKVEYLPSYYNAGSFAPTLTYAPEHPRCEDGSELSLDEQAQVLGCSLDSKETVSYPLSTGETAILVDDVMYYPSGKLHSAGLKTPTKFKVFGSSLLVAFQEDVTLSEDEKVLSGELSHYVMKRNGDFEVFLEQGVVYDQHQNSYVVGTDRTSINYWVDNVKMDFFYPVPVDTQDEAFNQSANQFCTNQAGRGINGDNDGVYLGNVYFSYTDTVNGTKYFYDIQKGQVVSLTDQPVQYTHDIGCIYNLDSGRGPEAFQFPSSK